MKIKDLGPDVLGRDIRLYITKDGLLSESGWCKTTTIRKVVGRSDQGHIIIHNEGLMVPDYMYPGIVQYIDKEKINEYNNTTWAMIPNLDIIGGAFWCLHPKINIPDQLFYSTSKVFGPYAYTKASDIQPGDTVSFDNRYAIVEELEEDEEGDRSVIKLVGRVFNPLGLCNTCINIKPDATVLLINRMEK